MRKLSTTMRVLMLLSVLLWPALHVSGQGLEDFTNSTATSSYTDGNFVGSNDITWTYIHSRNGNGDANGSGITLPALMLRRVSSASAITSSTISGGIGDFSVKLYKGFTGGGDRQVELLINGESKGLSTTFDDFDEHIFTVEDINISGDIVISIVNATEKQIIIDDITWTAAGGTPDPEPTNHVAVFAATDVDQNSITLTWEDNDGAQPADDFLIKANTGAITSPVDAIAEVDDTDMSDGAGAINISHGTQTCTITGLTALTDYNFEIYPYTNSGDEIDFKTDGTVPSITVSTSAPIVPTKLVITSIIPTSPIVNQSFDVVIEAQDASDMIGNVDQDTEVGISLVSGTGTISGTYSGTISVGTSTVTISDLMYDVVEDIGIGASTTLGMTLAPSATYSMTIRDIPAEPIVFISEYSESGAGNNKYVEVYNATGEEIDLAGIVVKLAANGGDWDNTHELTGTLAAGDVYVIANASAEQAILDVTDATSTITYFNGNDAVGLFVNDILVDAIGIQGVDPGAGWNVAGTTEATKDHTLVRKYPEVMVGNTDWALSAGTDEATSEWVVYAWDNYSNIGWHGPAPEEPMITNVSIAPVMPTSDDAVSVSADVTSPIGTISTVTLNWGTVSGILDQTVTMNVGTAPSYVTDTDIPAQVDGTVVYYTITAIDDAALETVTNEMSYTVNDPSTVALPYSHDFTDNNFGELVTYSVVGDQVWEVTTYGNPAPGAKVTGYAGQNYANEDWMITPGLDFSTVTEAKLVFDEAINYADDVNNEMPIMVSTDYEGTGDPSLATWTALDVTGRSTGDNWTFVTVNEVNLTAYAGEAALYIAFKYTSTTEGGATWEVDNIVVEEGGALIAPVIENIAINPAQPTTSDAVTISATITDANGTVETAVLQWGVDVFDNNTINMTIASDDTWVAETAIPAQANNTRIFYKIVATDNESNETTSDDFSYYTFDPYTGVLPYFEPFYYGLGTMNQTSVTGTQTWRWDEYGYAKVSGYSGGAQENEDWLITPSFDFSDVSSAVLNFREAINFAVNIADEQKVMISTDYDGTSAPSTATWTELTITNRPAGDSWSFVSVDEVDLADYVGETSVSIGFKYISTAAGAATWEIDEVSVSEGDGIIFNSASQVTVYPNPAHDELFISGAANGQISIITLDGKVVMSEQTTDNSINVSNLNDGLYIVRVISGNEVFTTRFVKK